MTTAHLSFWQAQPEAISARYVPVKSTFFWTARLRFRCAVAVSRVANAYDIICPETSWHAVVCNTCCGSPCFEMNIFWYLRAFWSGNFFFFNFVNFLISNDWLKLQGRGDFKKRYCKIDWNIYFYSLQRTGLRSTTLPST